MREFGRYCKLVIKTNVRCAETHRRQTVVISAAAGVLCSCVIASNLLKAFIQPTTTGASHAIAGFFGDDTAYYCARYGVKHDSIDSLCQVPSMVAGPIARTIELEAAKYTNACSSYDMLFRQYDWDITTAEAICQAESGGDPDAISSTNDYGLMQLHNLPIFDPAQNIAAAYQKYQLQGWNAWTTYNTGRYLAFL